jgi:hypothetical protein
MQAVVYALGLEGMLGPSRDVPLQHAVTDYLETPSGDVSVIRSEVLLEITGAKGRALTVCRTIKGERSRNLISVWEGHQIEAASERMQSTEYHVRVSGSATADSGFHRLLADFIGWRLPSVPTFSGSDVPLYLEILFPLLYVEQKNGWGAIEGRFPTHLRVREAGARAVEFILGLDARGLAERRANIKLAQETVRQRWSQAVRASDSSAKAVGAVLKGAPATPTSDWPGSHRVSLMLPVEDQWIPLVDIVGQMQRQGETHEQQEPETIEVAAPRLQDDIRTAEAEVRQNELRVRGLLEAVAGDQGELERLQSRIVAIDEDLVRNRDARTLKNLGAATGVVTSTGSCPTCHQQMSEALLPPDLGHQDNPMSVEQNIAYLDEQRKLFAFMTMQVSSAMDARTRQLAAERERLNESRAKVRSLRRALTSDARVPDSTAIEGRVRASVRIERLLAAQGAALEHLNPLTELASDWARLTAELVTLEEVKVSDADARKLKAFQASFSEQVEAYGVRSVEPDEIEISADTFRATYQDFELQFDLSASDTIRSAWAYRTALLEVGRTEQTNHPGVLMFDEPRQQEVSRESLTAFLARLGRSASAGEQVIVATSEPLESLRIMLDGTGASVLSFEGRILERLRH